MAKKVVCSTIFETQNANAVCASCTCLLFPTSGAQRCTCKRSVREKWEPKKLTVPQVKPVAVFKKSRKGKEGKKVVPTPVLEKLAVPTPVLEEKLELGPLFTERRDDMLAFEAVIPPKPFAKNGDPLLPLSNLSWEMLAPASPLVSMPTIPSILSIEQEAMGEWMASDLYTIMTDAVLSS